MTITVNGERREFAAGTSVAAVVSLLGARPRGTAVAVNGEVVPRGQWSTRTLAPGDAVEVLVAVQGG